jgi:hypothetical protein
MSKQYISINEIRKDLPDFSFYQKYLTRDIHPIEKKMQNLTHLKIYQSRRFYLDEHPEQDKLRKEYFEGKDCYNVCMKMLNSILINATDVYFYNRWIKRN